jgi:hypothetical protein
VSTYISKSLQDEEEARTVSAGSSLKLGPSDRIKHGIYVRIEWEAL